MGIWGLMQRLLLQAWSFQKTVVIVQPPTVLCWLVRLETGDERLGVALGERPVLTPVGVCVKFGPCVWHGVVISNAEVFRVQADNIRGNTDRVEMPV